jgi:serine/threonine protein kinase
VVWRGRDAVSGGAVVVTLLEDHPQADATLAALVAVRHPSLPVILDHGVEGETRYLVTPARAGQTARLRLSARGQLTGADAAALGAAVADALATLHERGLVQGSVSLDALILDETGPPRLEDLATAGLARPADQPDDDVRALAAILRELLAQRF